MRGFYTVKENSITPPRDRLQPALDRIIKDNGMRTALNELAKLTGLSVTHFRRLFRETFSETPAKYALRLRLNRARESLENTTAIVADIATDAGFCDQSHFIHAFKHVYKLSPSEYRLRHNRQK